MTEGEAAAPTKKTEKKLQQLARVVWTEPV